MGSGPNLQTKIVVSTNIPHRNTHRTSVAHQNWREVDQRPNSPGKLKKLVQQVKIGLTQPEKVPKSSNDILMLSEHGQLQPQHQCRSNSWPKNIFKDTLVIFTDVAFCQAAWSNLYYPRMLFFTPLSLSVVRDNQVVSLQNSIFTGWTRGTDFMEQKKSVLRYCWYPSSILTFLWYAVVVVLSW